MATKLSGRLMLNKIPKEKVICDTDNNGNPRKYIWVDILEKKNPDQYGCTHTIVFYNKDTREKIYLGDFKPQEFGGSATASAPAGAPASAPAPQDEASDDLPF